MQGAVQFLLRLVYLHPSESQVSKGTNPELSIQFCSSTLGSLSSACWVHQNNVTKLKSFLEEL